ncbi:MAG: type II toxin-antitoxin system RelE/ParE family toxin [Robiginitomaculum sp.]|nr:type II toxin-antitoxin system RelE/ParE family toxin [Robiginitomaculum sp.]
MKPVQWTDTAKGDLKRLYEFLFQKNADAAKRAIELILHAVDILYEFPEAGRKRLSSSDFREIFARFGAGGFVVRYRILDERVIIVRIWHSLESREPPF